MKKAITVLKPLYAVLKRQVLPPVIAEKPKVLHSSNPNYPIYHSLPDKYECRPFDYFDNNASEKQVQTAYQCARAIKLHHWLNIFKKITSGNSSSPRLFGFLIEKTDWDYTGISVFNRISITK